jgi:chromosome partitioning protein
LLTLNALAATEEVLIPLQPHFLALQGFGKLLQTVELVNKRINPDLKVKGVLLCMFDTRASLPNEVRADIEHFLESARGTNCAWAQAQILPTLNRRNIKLAEAPSYGQTIFEYERNCHGAEDYMKVAESIHNQFQPMPQLDIQDEIGEAEEGGHEQAEEPSAVESVQEENIPAPADVSQRPDIDPKQNQNKPPIEIKAIPQPDTEVPSSEFIETTPPDTEQTQTE